MDNKTLFIILLVFVTGVGVVPLVDISYDEEYEVTVTYDESVPYTEEEQYTEQIPHEIWVDESETLFDTGIFFLDCDTRKVQLVYLTEGHWVGLYYNAEEPLYLVACSQEEWIKWSNNNFKTKAPSETLVYQMLPQEAGFYCPSTGWYEIYLENYHHCYSTPPITVKVFDFTAVHNWQETVTVYLPEVKTRTVTKYRTVTKERTETHTRTVTRKGTILELIIG
jgi:hypothetical protein